MQSISHLHAIPDDELLRRLATLLGSSRRTEAELVAHIGEVDARRLYSREAAPSMFVYCLERLHLSEAEAYRRIAAARASRAHPIILEMLADGRLHLTGIALLAPHLTPENRDALLERATHKTRRQVEELVAERAPRPDVRPSIRKLPLGRLVTGTAPSQRIDGEGLVPPVAPAGGAHEPTATALALRPEQADSERLDEVAAGSASDPGASRAAGDREESAAGTSEAAVARRWVARRECRSVRVEPLSPSRYSVQFTASAELRETLERLRALMRSSVPDGDLAAVIEAAVTEKLERLEARRFGQTKAPGKRAPTRELEQAETAPSSRHVPAAVRRAVHERDGGRCAYVDEHGRRCTARTGLEFHHRHPYALGGGHSVMTVSELCKGHNQYLARIDFGGKAIGQRRRGT